MEKKNVKCLDNVYFYMFKEYIEYTEWNKIQY